MNLPLELWILLTGVIVAMACGLLIRWDTRRTRRRWDREATVRQQLCEMEDQIWRESLPDGAREAIERRRQERVEIKREARRRLGLRDDDDPV
jgi:hypothetical protein